MAEWYNIGVQAFGSLNGAPYSKAGSFPTGQQFSYAYRFGKPENLNSRRGMVIRAMYFVGEFDNLRVDGMPYINISAGVGACKQLYGTSIPVPAGTSGAAGKAPWALEIFDSTVPIGLLRQGAGDPNTNQWAGVSTNGFVVLLQGPTAVNNKPTLSNSVYLLSPKPTWAVTHPVALTQGQTGQRIQLRVAYPDGEAVNGLRMRFTCADNALSLFTGGSWVSQVYAYTDSNGNIDIPVRANSTSGSAVIMELDDPRCELDYFSPPLSATLGINAASAVVGGRTCVVLPPIAPTPYKPAVEVLKPTYAWDAGATSITNESGDAVLTCVDMVRCVGAIVGIAPTQGNDADRTRITHGFYFFTGSNGAPRAQAVERGQARGPVVTYGVDTYFEIQRVGDRVSYLVDGGVIYRSTVPSTGTVWAACALYAPGDSV